MNISIIPNIQAIINILKKQSNKILKFIRARGEKTDMILLQFFTFGCSVLLILMFIH
jgi:hypothetical protein